MSAPMPAAAFAAAQDATVIPHDLPFVLDAHPGIKVLSLDCFDTLIWRDCHAPTDLFATLPGIMPLQRMASEMRARALARTTRGALDVSIEAIYEALMPRADARTRAAAIAAELAAEARHCQAFGPTVALMRAARARGIKVIIVSDTYLGQQQLTQLIARAAGDEVAGLIDRVFCSSSWGKTKANGLYGEVLARIKVRADQVLHIGDNHAADIEGVRPFGVRTMHLVQFEPPIAQQLRLESVTAGILFGHARDALGVPQPHRPALAIGLPQEHDPARRLGMATLGPLFHGFEGWLQGEAAALARRPGAPEGSRVHWLFLMRDGHLPMDVHRASGGDMAHAHPIEISRLTATIASLTTDTALTAFLAEQELTAAPDLGKLLQIDEAVIERICKGRDPHAARAALGRWCAEPANRRLLLAKARAMAERLAEHVRARVRPAPGDTLMLVDLGYRGSVQNMIGEALGQALGVHVAGRYLLLRETEISGLDMAGYLDQSHVDIVALHAIAGNIAVIEQLATTAMGSVINYSEAGEPIRDTNSIKSRQSAIRAAVQAGCLAFIGHARDAVVRGAPPDDTLRQWREANAAGLMRLLFLPLPHEVDTITAFEHDVNLGTDEMVTLFDPAAAQRGLRQKGLFYQIRNRRMFLPAEMAGQPMALRLAHLATSRFASPLTFEDVLAGDGHVPVVLVTERGEEQVDCPTRPTHDGFFALCIGLGAARHPVAVQLGAIAPFVEIEAVLAVSIQTYIRSRGEVDRSGEDPRVVPLTPLLDNIDMLSDTVWQCRSTSAFALLTPPALEDVNDLMLVLIYRPVGASHG